MVALRRGKDIFEYILCGAKAVQVGTHLVRHGPKIFETLAGELENIMKLKSYKTINDFLGQVKVVGQYFVGPIDCN